MNAGRRTTHFIFICTLFKMHFVFDSQFCSGIFRTFLKYIACDRECELRCAMANTYSFELQTPHCYCMCIDNSLSWMTFRCRALISRYFNYLLIQLQHAATPNNDNVHLKNSISIVFRKYLLHKMIGAIY